MGWGQFNCQVDITKAQVDYVAWQFLALVFSWQTVQIVAYTQQKI